MTKTKPEPTQRIAGRYAVLSQLGEGGMGVVYRVRDDVGDRVVALKQLRAGSDGKRPLLEAMLGREYHTLARLKHPRVIEVYDYGRDEAGPYYTMQLLTAGDLRARAPLPYRDACRHLRDVASSLALLHAQRLVHRDVSPRNVCFSDDGSAKLIDFGALHAFGAPADVVGTPPCIAPEAFRRMPIDHRTDLFSLGAVAYFALSARHAYPVRELADLQAYWNRGAKRLRELVPEIPPALDELVMALLSLEPTARPGSDAEVIERLGAIGGLLPEELPARAAYLHSSRMVGRDEEVAWVEERVRRCLAGRGTAILLEGPAGIVRTRLLHELGLRAQLLGTLVLKVDAAAQRGAFSIATALGQQLLATRPDAARRAARGHEHQLARLSPEIATALDRAPEPAMDDDGAIARAEIPGAILAWFGELSRTQALVLAVDNVHAGDDASVGLLTQLTAESKKRRLLILGTRRAGEATEPSGAVQALRKRAAYLKLASLSPASCVDVVKSLFGDVPQSGRLGRLVYDRTGGNPQLCIDLAELLVKLDLVQYVSGSWVLPAEVDPSLLPNRDDVLIQSRLAGLSSDARTLAEVLSLDPGRISLDFCLAWSEAETEAHTHAALDELVSARVLLEEQAEYRFEQATLRDAVLAHMDGAKRSARHRRLAEALGTAESLGLRVKAAWHWLEAGEHTRGADTMARLGYECFRAGGLSDDALFIIRALQRAAEVYEREGRSPAESCALLFPLVALSLRPETYAHVLRYGERALELGLDFTGLRRAQQRSRWFGAKLALASSLGQAALGRSIPKKQLGYGLREAMVMFSATAFATLGSVAASFDVDRVARIRALLTPLALFGDALPGMIHRFAATQQAIVEGRLGDVDRCTAEDKTWLRRPDVIRALGESRQKHVLSAVLIVESMVAVLAIHERIQSLLHEIDALGPQAQAQRESLLSNFHRLRGEVELANLHADRADLLTAGSAGAPDLRSGFDVAVLAADVIALRRWTEQLRRWTTHAPGLHPHLQVSQAAYQALRGDLPAALAMYDSAAQHFRPWKRLGWQSAMAAHADALNHAGEHTRARELMLQALADWSPLDLELVFLRIPLERQLALADAALGNTADATARIDDLLGQYADKDHPLLVGLLHKTRAEIALVMRDPDTFEREHRHMTRQFHASKNPSLIAQCGQLAARAADSGVRPLQPNTSAQGTRDLDDFVSIYRTLPEITAASDRHDYALRLMLQRASAKTGWLYRLEDRTLHLVASTSTELPPADVEGQLRSRLDRLANEAAEQTDLTVASATAGEHPACLDDATDRTRIIEADSEEPEQASHYRALVLVTHRHDRQVLVGGAILQAADHAPTALAPAFLEAIADSLHARGIMTVHGAPEPAAQGS